MAMFGWTNAKMVRTDTRKAAENKLAASGAAKSLSHFYRSGRKYEAGSIPTRSQTHEKT